MGKNVSLVKIVAFSTHNQENAQPVQDKKYIIQLLNNANV